MASRNQIALSQGRITQRQFESMAAAKFTYHNNWEDLDVEESYTRYDIVKWYPVITFATHDDRPIVSIRGFVKYMMDKVGVTDYDMDAIVRDHHDGDSDVTFTYRELGWTWISDRGCSIMDKMHQMIYYTFGECFGAHAVSPLAEYCLDYTEMYE